MCKVPSHQEQLRWVNHRVNAPPIGVSPYPVQRTSTSMTRLSNNRFEDTIGRFYTSSSMDTSNSAFGGLSPGSVQPWPLCPQTLQPWPDTYHGVFPSGPGTYQGLDPWVLVPSVPMTTVTSSSMPRSSMWAGSALPPLSGPNLYSLAQQPSIAQPVSVLNSSASSVVQGIVCPCQASGPVEVSLNKLSDTDLIDIAYEHEERKRNAGHQDPDETPIPATKAEAADPGQTAIYCKHCQTWLNGPRQNEDHVIGKKHKKAVKKTRQKTRPGAPDPSTVHQINANNQFSSTKRQRWRSPALSSKRQAIYEKIEIIEKVAPIPREITDTVGYSVTANWLAEAALDKRIEQMEMESLSSSDDEEEP